MPKYFYLSYVVIELNYAFESREKWSLGRLEEYKELQSSIKWMIFDTVYDVQDVSLKTADVFILLSYIEEQREYFAPYVICLAVAIIVAGAMLLWRFR